MTTPSTTSNNKAALRASLKKEDESLAERLVATDVPLVPPAEPESSEAVASGTGGRKDGTRYFKQDFRL